MSLARADVLKIAHLARLAVEEESIPKYLKELSNILELVDQMESVDTNAIEPMAHPLAETQRLRPDVVTETNQRDLFLSLAPTAEAGLYLVPKVIETT